MCCVCCVRNRKHRGRKSARARARQREREKEREREKCPHTRARARAHTHTHTLIHTQHIISHVLWDKFGNCLLVVVNYHYEYANGHVTLPEHIASARLSRRLHFSTLLSFMSTPMVICQIIGHVTLLMYRVFVRI